MSNIFFHSWPRSARQVTSIRQVTLDQDGMLIHALPRTVAVFLVGLSCSLGTSVASAQATETEQPVVKTNWQLVWSDEFEKDGRPDPAKWSPLVPPYGCESVGWDKRTIRQADGRRGGLHSRGPNAKCARAPAHRNACSIPETAHPTANAGVRMRRLANGNRILVGRRSLCCGSCRDLLTDPFRGSILAPLVRLSHPTDARA